MTSELKEFIENHLQLIENYDFDSLYAAAETEFPVATFSGELTSVLHSIELDPLENSSKIYSGYLCGCENIDNFEIPDSIRVVEDLAFAGTSLSSIIFPKNVEEIGSYIFESCENLNQVTIMNPRLRKSNDSFAYINNRNPIILIYNGTIDQFEQFQEPLFGFIPHKIICLDGELSYDA